MLNAIFLLWSAAVAAGRLRTAGAARALPRRVRTRRVRLAWAGPVGLRIVQLSDLHIDGHTPPALLDAALRQVRAARPDLVVLTGDYVATSLNHMERLERFVAALPRPCLATLGNHDHWCGAAEVVRALQRQGVGVLRNASTTLWLRGQPLRVVGVDDGRSGHADLRRAFAGLADPERALVLTHDPSIAGGIAACGGRLILAGHTHGGQLHVPGLTALAARLAGIDYLAGWYRVGPARLYVNVGLDSAVFRLRLGRCTTPEVTVLELRASGVDHPSKSRPCTPLAPSGGGACAAGGCSSPQPS